MRTYERSPEAYRVTTQCGLCGKSRQDIIPTDEELSKFEIDSIVFDATNEAGWRWFGSFHKCKECIKGGPMKRKELVRYV